MNRMDDDWVENTFSELQVLSMLVAFLGGTSIWYLILKHFFEPGISPDDLVGLAEVIAATAPLTIATAALYQFAAHGGGGFMGMVVIGAILWMSVILGNVFGAGIDGSGLRWHSLWHPAGWVSVFRVYLGHYGLGLFVSSLVIGTYIGYKLEHGRRRSDRSGAAPPGGVE